jgi:hypothetical protein
MVCREPVHGREEVARRPGHPDYVVPRVVLSRGRLDRYFDRSQDWVGWDVRQHCAAKQQDKTEYDCGETTDERHGNAAAQFG